MTKKEWGHNGSYAGWNGKWAGIILKFPIEEFINNSGNDGARRFFQQDDISKFVTINSMTVSLIVCLVFFSTNLR